MKLPFKIMMTDPKSKHALETVTNPYSGESCQLPRYAVAVYDVIKGAELLRMARPCARAWTGSKNILLINTMYCLTSPDQGPQGPSFPGVGPPVKRQASSLKLDRLQAI